MRLDSNPIHRREIIPWYDSDAAGFVMIALMTASLLFGTVGIVVARQNPAYHGYTWVPAVVIVMSGGIVVSTAVRMIKRYMRRIAD